MTAALPLAFMDIGFGEMIVVAFVALMVFGGRLPEMMRKFGASYREFKRGLENVAKNPLTGAPPPGSSRSSAPFKPTLPAFLEPKPVVPPAPSAYPPMPQPIPDPTFVKPAPEIARPAAATPSSGPTHPSSSDDAPMV